MNSERAPASFDATAQAQSYDTRALLHEIGRGQKGARGLDRTTARELVGAMIDGRVGELEMGGLLVAWRFKGESLDELTGALDAVHSRLHPWPIGVDRPVVSIPSYNGARRQINQIPLLAALLARAGVQVVIHGVRRDPGRLTTARIMQELARRRPELACVADSMDAAAAGMRQGLPAFVPIDVLAPGLAALLALRDRLGVRHIGHSVVKLLDPVACGGRSNAAGEFDGSGATDTSRESGGPGEPSVFCDSARRATIRLASFTHPEFNRLQHELLERTGATAVVLRGTDGEAYAGARRTLQLDLIRDGRTQRLVDRADLPVLPGALADGTPVDGLPPVIDVLDLDATVAWTVQVLDGQRPVPVALQVQFDAMLAVAGR